MADQIAIRVDNVSKDFVLPHEKTNSIKGVVTGAVKKRANAYSGNETQHALKDITFDIKKGEFFGIVGRNGSGKSTLLKILAGIYQPTGGSVSTAGKLVPFIELGVGFNPELTGRENVYLNGAMLGFSEKQVSDLYEDIVEFAELERFMDQKLKNYSSGMQVRLAFSMAVRADADILLIDEVLAVGDADFQRKCFDYFKKLKKDKKTVVFVSHDMGAVREFCDKAMLINESEITSIGETDKIASQYAQLFIKEKVNDGKIEVEENEIVDQEGKRWGNGRIQIKDVKVTLSDENIIIKAESFVNKVPDPVMYGIHIFGPDGVEILSLNNRMIQQPDITNLKEGDEVSFDWKMQNIFSDGKYYVGLTLVNESGVAYDWCTEAATFTVKRAQRSTTAILPPVSVHYIIS